MASSKESSKEQLQQQLAELSSLLTTVPHAEEAKSVWLLGTLPPSALDSPLDIVRTLARTNPHVIPLQVIARGLARAKSTRLPLGIAVRALKASWHVDASWPLRGFDEGPPDPTDLPDSEEDEGAASAGSESDADSEPTRAPLAPLAPPDPQTILLSLPRSPWPRSELVCPPLPATLGPPSRPMEPGPPPRPDPSPKQVAKMYARRERQAAQEQH